MEGTTMGGLLIPGIVVIGIILYVISIYNALQTALTRIEAAIQEIGNQLKRQASLIPNLESSVKGYLKHEKDIMQMLTDARKTIEKASKSSDAATLDSVESQLSNLSGKLQILVESNPEIKGDGVVTNLMNELRDTADKLMYSRRAVIDLTQNYNQMLVTIPSSLVANAFGFKKEKGLATPTSGAHIEVSEKETEDVKVSL